MFRIFLFLSFYLVCSASTALFAQIYEYKDKQGVLHFTNDIMKVPTHLRDHVKKYDEIKSPPASGVKPSSGPKTASKKAKAAPETPGRLTEGHKEKDLRSLINQKRRELDQEYQNLMNEKERIAAETKTWRIRYSVRKRKSVARGKINGAQG
ncbi:MAG: DUF4124 domain-containing protein [Deltaproteobacteria bacterium]|nr:DUF4124 domain-containing protein [Deltaproteobacteria bacterium]MBW2152878.1 DUF4124 domain-containing protein [Deltaproteobacteria bacterium]